MKKTLFSAVILISSFANATVVDDYNAPLLIEGKKVFPYLLSKNFSKSEALIINELSNLDKFGATESFCKGWGYNKKYSYYQLFLYRGAYSMIQEALGGKSVDIISETMKISEMHHKATEPYLIFMKKKAETGTENDKWVYENRICGQQVSILREYSAAGIFMAVKEIEDANAK